MFDIIDALDDVNNFIGVVIEKENDFPAFVKAASIEYGQAGRDKKSIFAYPEKQKFPLDTPSDIVLSHAYFQKTAHLLPNEFVRAEVSQRIKRASVFAGVPLDFSKPAVIGTKQASIPNEEFLVRVKTANCKETTCQDFNEFIQNDEIVMYPMQTPDQIKMANLNFPNALTGELVLQRPSVARKLASMMPFDDLTPAVQAYLPMKRSSFEIELESRAIKFPKFASLYERIKDSVDETTDPTKVALLVNELDKRSGAVEHYGKQIKEASIFLNGVQATPKAPAKIFIKEASFPITKLIEKEASLKAIIPTLDLSDPAQVQETISASLVPIQNVVYSVLMR